jgi:hypothetical protein
MKVKYTIFFFSCFVYFGVTAQTNFYSFSQTSAAYTPLSGDTIARPSDWVNGIEYTNGMAGTAFSFFGKTFHFNDQNVRLSYTSDGNIIIQDDTAQFVISGLETIYDSVDAQTAISFRQTTGSNGAMLALQWQNVKLHNGPAGNFANFQIFLNLTTGAAEVHYGPGSANNASGYTNVSGPRAGITYFNKTTAQTYERIVVSGPPSALVIDSTKNAVAFTLTGVPPSGTVYRYTPRQQAASAVQAILPGSDLQVSPNPFQYGFTISSDAPQPYTVTDVCGRQISSGHTTTARHKVDASCWPPGIYYLHMQRGAIKILLKK